MCLITGLITLLGGGAALGSAMGMSAAAAGTTLAIAEAAAAAATAGGIASTAGGVQQARNQAAMAQAQADIEEENARLANRQAEQLDLQANQERDKLRLRMLSQQGEARGQYAAGGVVLGAGTPSDYEADIMDAYDMDRRNLDYDVASKKWKLQVQAANSTDQASLYRAQASGYNSGASTSLLSGAFSTIGQGMSAFGGGLNLGRKLTS